MFMTLQDVIALILCIVAVPVLVLISICLVYAIGTLQRINGIVKKNEKNINDIVEMLPGTIKEVDTTVKSVNEIIEVVTPTVKNVSGAIDKTATTVSDFNTNVLQKVVNFGWVVDAVKAVVGFISEKFGKGDKDEEVEFDTQTGERKQTRAERKKKSKSGDYGHTSTQPDESSAPVEEEQTGDAN